jgi:erythromycin esterase-like protein/adenine/guanine phosphoribosyltransferase-like PRPP-binding protein
LAQYAGRSDVIALGLPRGGIPVAFEVAETLGIPLDVLLVRKLGMPGHEETAIGAIASGGVRVLDEELVRALNIPASNIAMIEEREQHELRRRERVYRGSRSVPDVSGRTVLLIDDGLATGATMQAAVAALRQQQPALIVGAVPVASAEVSEEMAKHVDEMVCVETPDPFYAVGLWYNDFGPTSDEEVCALLRQAQETLPAQLLPFPTEQRLAQLVKAAAIGLDGADRDYDALMSVVGDARVVLLGEATHGSHEFYRERARITRRLIEELGFSAVAVEADWPDAYRVNRYVRGMSPDPNGRTALADFHRFPRWMWRNEDVLDFVEWLRGYNDRLPSERPKIGFYGLDLYSLRSSIDAVIRYLDKVDPEGARRARARYACFDHFGDDPQMYGYATELGMAEPCESDVIGQLLEMQRRAGDLARRDGRVEEDEFFFAEQNARLARNAEAYYRAMFSGRVRSWNVRDGHMAEMLGALHGHLDRPDNRVRIIVWAHNSHVGDARATEMSAAGELNLGQLVRQQYGHDAVLIGFTTYAGTVTAAHDWDEPGKRRRVKPGLPGSWEAVFHTTGLEQFLLPIPTTGALAEQCRQPRLERAIGVVYRPETERFSHYVNARIGDQFDAVLHFDTTTALHPLEKDAGWERGDELPETFPFAV